MDTNGEELQIKVVFPSLCQGMLEGLRHRDAYHCLLFILLLLLLLLCINVIISIIIIIVVVIIIIITIVFSLNLVKIHINYKTNLKNQNL